MINRKPSRSELVSALSSLLAAYYSLVQGAYAGTSLIQEKTLEQDHLRKLLLAEEAEPELRIVCSASRSLQDSGVMFLGVRHFDALMRNAIDNHYQGERIKFEDGFVDQLGNFHSRTEAWKIAEAAGQILHRCGGDDANGGTLYSENLY